MVKKVVHLVTDTEKSYERVLQSGTISSKTSLKSPVNFDRYQPNSQAQIDWRGFCGGLILCF